MRKLQTHDIFAFGRVIKEIGIKEEVKCICMKANTIGDLYESGFELIFGIFEKCTSEEAENALIKFFADILEEDPQAVKECDPVEFMDKIFEVAEPEKWKAFFTRVASLIQ